MKYLSRTTGIWDKIKIRFIFISLMLMLSACSFTSVKEPQYLFKASMLVKENHTWYKAFIHFGKLIEERSEGRMKLEVYPSEQLAKELEAIRLIKRSEEHTSELQSHS